MFITYLLAPFSRRGRPENPRSKAVVKIGLTIV